MLKSINRLKLLSAVACLLAVSSYAATHSHQQKIENTVDSSIRPLLQEYEIPGIAVGITIKGKHYFYNYGLMSKATGQPVTDQTLFEIGSVSKTFTATLACYAQLTGKLSLTDNVSKYLPSLAGSKFESVNLINLGTHTAGGFPLQVPDNVNSTAELVKYLQNWKPEHAPGTYRNYSNVSIGILGMITANSLNQKFEDAISKEIFNPLGMKNSFIDVPAEKMKDYAQGYTKDNNPIRLAPGFFATEVYAVKTSSADLIRFIEANMQINRIDATLQRAITGAHTGYFKAGEMTQDLIWEQYSYPVSLKQLLDGNSNDMIYGTIAADKLAPPAQPQENVLINKTGTTNGFAAYVAFIPAKKVGVVILANKNYPIPARVTVAYQILERLAQE